MSVEDPSKDTYDDSHVFSFHGHHFLSNDSFIEFFLHHELLGKLPISEATQVVTGLRNKIITSSDFTAKLKQCKEMQPGLISLATVKQSKSFVSPNATTKKMLKVSNSMSPERKLNTQESRVTEDVFDIEESKACRALKLWWNGGHFKPGLAIVVWLFAASIFFVYVNKWGFNEAFYYSVQSGLSVGFGSLSEEKITGKNVFEKCIPANGANASTRLVSLVLEAQKSSSLPEMAVHESFENHQLCIYKYTPNPLSSVSMAYTVLHICLGASVIGGALSLFTAMAVESSKDWFEEANDAAKAEHKQNQHKSIVEAAGMVESSPGNADEKEDKPRSCIACGCRWNRKALFKWLSESSAERKAVSFLFVYVWAGAVTYTILEEVNVIKGLYFAVAALSTAGLAGPSPDNMSCVTFTGLFTLFGVPMYAYTLSIFANGATASYIQTQATKRRLHAINESEFAAADRLHNTGSGDTPTSIDNHEFALLWFLRNQLISPEDIKSMEQDFEDLDADKNKLFDQSEMQAANMYTKYDVNGDQELSAAEFLPLIRALQKTKSLSVKGIMLLDPTIEYTAEDIKLIMRAYEDEKTVKRVESVVKQKDKSGKMKKKKKMALHHTFNRREYMEWWSDEFYAYRDRIGDGGPKGVHMRALQLDAIKQLRDNVKTEASE